MAWLQKLCGEAAIGEVSKRTRNVYLSHLVLEMQEGRLMPPFLEYPPEGKLPLAVDVFGPESASVKSALYLSSALAPAAPTPPPFCLDRPRSIFSEPSMTLLPL
uniref:DUF4485 domain-containing protein n=1 Tax=Timema poppense TaxID=170557 RepID=A0A7R9HAV0_TIMPO|nr:unnamed protein product [Timema poppensis]